jgi:AcrR family transcriptional regulator
VSTSTASGEQQLAAGEVTLAEDRRAQVLRSAATIIAERGMRGATMRAVAKHAGATTGMLTHYFSSRSDIVMQTLRFVSESMQTRARVAIEGIEPGEERLRAYLRASLPFDAEVEQAWRVWIAAYATALASPAARQMIGWRHELWWDILDEALEGLPLRNRGPADVGWPEQLNAFVMGLVIQEMTSDAVRLAPEQMEAAVVAFLLEPSKRTSARTRGA